MQKFVVKKISRSTNITLSAEDHTFVCNGELKPQSMAEDLEVSSVKMSGYLKKKRNVSFSVWLSMDKSSQVVVPIGNKSCVNHDSGKAERVGGWNKLYFVLQNSLLMSYNSRDEYENKLVSFKDVICLIPGNTVLLPSLEPRFTIASNQNTFYTFRCDDNKICSKWITAILECLSRDIDLAGTGKISNVPKQTFCSQQNLSHRPKPICNVNHSWESLPTTNWIVNNNGRILLELNCNRAKLPIAAKTAKILQNFTDSDVITTSKKVNFIQNDENSNCIRNADHNELRVAHDKNYERFRLHNEEEKPKMRQSKEVDLISKMFAQKSESQRPEKLTQINGNDYSEIGIEEQVQAMSFGDETGDYSSIFNGNFQSFDSKKFNNTLCIEENLADYAEVFDSNDEKQRVKEAIPEYATVDINRKREARIEKMINENGSLQSKKDEKPIVIYEDIGSDDKTRAEDTNIYELIDIPLRPSQKSRSLVWKNWSRMHLFDFTKRFKENSEVPQKLPSPETISKRQKASLTLSDFSKRFNYRSMRKRAKKMCSKSGDSALVTNDDLEQSSDKDASSSHDDKLT